MGMKPACASEKPEPARRSGAGPSLRVTGRPSAGITALVVTSATSTQATAACSSWDAREPD